MILGRTITAGLVSAALAVSCGAATHPPRETRTGQCRAVRLDGHTSLAGFGRKEKLSVSDILYLIIRCDDRGGWWTSTIARDLDGRYGPNPATAILPAGTRVWEATIAS